MAVDPLERRSLGLDLALELRFPNLFQDRGEVSARLEAVTHKVMARDERRGIDRAGRLDFQIVLAIVDVLGIARRCQRVGAMKRQQIVDPGLRQDPLELRLAEFLGLAQVLMKSDQPVDSLAFGVGEFQIATKPVAELCADLLVVVKAIAAVVKHPRPRLTDVVQERREGESKAGIGGQQLEHEHRVVPQITLGLHRLPLKHPFHRQQIGEDGGDQARFESQLHRLRPALVHEHFSQFLGNSLLGDGDDLAGHRLDRGQRGGFDLKLKSRRQADRPQHAQLVLAESSLGVADGAEDVILQVRMAPDVVDQRVGERIKKHPIDREIAAGRVELGRAEYDRFGPPAVDISTVAPEGRNLDLGSRAGADAGPARRRTRSRR